MTDRQDMDSRWKGVKRPYSTADVARLSGSVRIEYVLVRGWWLSDS
jgi:isocitrate lyase